MSRTRRLDSAVPDRDAHPRAHSDLRYSLADHFVQYSNLTATSDVVFISDFANLQIDLKVDYPHWSEKTHMPCFVLNRLCCRW